LCCDVGLVSELRLTAGSVLMDLASPAVSGTSVYANGLTDGEMVCLLDMHGFVHFGTQVRGFAPDRSRQILGTKKFSARLPSDEI